MKEMIYRPSKDFENLSDACQILDEGTYNNYHYMIVSYGTHPCAYVELPKDHKWYGKHYDYIPIKCHGSLTYSSDSGVVFPDDHPNHRDGFWIGWDYSHYDDYYPFNTIFDDLRFISGKKWTTEEILEEVHNVIDQL